MNTFGPSTPLSWSLYTNSEVLYSSKNVKQVFAQICHVHEHLNYNIYTTVMLLVVSRCDTESSTGCIFFRL